MKSKGKTNAIRILEQMGIHFETREYQADESDLSARAVALKVNLPLEQVFKTLVLKGDRTGHLVAVIPGNREADMKALAALSGNKRVELIDLKDLQPLTGYVRGGCSPVGMKRHFPTYIDESARSFPFISVSAGVRGMQVLMNPHDLLRATSGSWGKISREG
ncbi:Cys-tRNA(Pro) deacylase [Thermanaerovibrio acidaminovorans]|uniref:Cys-tRNA(Pro)/Cys-tRNA(Cys) deacylase n=2 Tax=Thermanaerovibrio TaxID=81461 RepID=D1B807_THEAS|nr:Cys-tRNA(Pro) deacylase [Thermanaerovibrio acidaminovorans]ACZ18410.1 ybaK/ebsC protein [Thermanaerovibrio acidaminovorans DSM 6589]